jgi:hypothetical protein
MGRRWTNPGFDGAGRGPRELAAVDAPSSDMRRIHGHVWVGMVLPYTPAGGSWAEERHSFGSTC